jgi:thiol-disulfide isomerase/thioredoxin
MKNFRRSRRNIWRILILMAMLLAFALPSSGVRASTEEDAVNIYFFWGEGCPHCAVAKPVLEELAASNAQIYFYNFEVYKHPENVDLFYAFGNAYNIEPKYVPTIFVGDQYWEGYSPAMGEEITNLVERCLEGACEDPGKTILSELRPELIQGSEQQPTTPEGQAPSDTPEAITTPESTITPEPTPTPAVEPTQPVVNGEGTNGRTISLPLIGTIDLSQRSLLVSTLLISFVDGFNPCSIWVLSMLLAIALNTQSRKKVLIIGSVFIFVTGFIYALFIGGLFSILRVIRFIGWIQVLVSVVALLFGLINIKDYFWYKEGFSLSISDEKKPGIYKGIRRVLNADESIWVLIGSTVVLAAGVSLVEFSCTAGFPVLWTNLLNAQNVSTGTFLGLLLVYMLVYQIDEMGIFLVSVFTLRKTKLEEKHGRILKLLGGMLMLTLAAVMIINPALMNDMSQALIIFGIAFGLTALVLLVHRVILPKFNIKIGSEQ